jgi:hypothetical protein
MRSYWYHERDHYLTFNANGQPAPGMLIARGFHKISRACVEREIPGGRMWLANASLSRVGVLFGVRAGRVMPVLGGALIDVPLVPRAERIKNGYAFETLTPRRYDYSQTQKG